jgi:glycosyltransferase involved in cell wall biosynthesis
MILTLVIPTYNRAPLLSRALQSIQASIDPPRDAELLVVDNNSSDDTEKLVSEFVASGPVVSCRYLFEQEQGLSYARNAGLREARGRYIAYMDDEQEICPHYLKRVAAAFERTGADCVGGRILYKSVDGVPAWLKPLIDRIGQIDLGPETLKLHHGDPYLKGGNIAFDSAVLRAIGGFDAGLGRNGEKLLDGEEDAAQDALRSRGYTVAYCPELVQYNALLPEKLHKRYWRAHAYWGGRSSLRRSQDSWNAAVVWFGVPRSMYRSLGRSVARLVVSSATRDDAERFQRERDVWRTLGMMNEARAIAKQRNG